MRACTVLVDVRWANFRLMLVVMKDGVKVTTIDGL